jgi:hypothetical protein
MVARRSFQPRKLFAAELHHLLRESPRLRTGLPGRNQLRGPGLQEGGAVR